MVSSSAAFALAYSSGLILPCWRSISSWNNSSFIASSNCALRSRTGAAGSLKSAKSAGASPASTAPRPDVSPAGTIVVGRGLRSAHGPPAARIASARGLCALGLKRARAGDAETEVLSRLDVGGHHDACARFIGHGLKLLRILGREGHALGRHHDEVLHFAERLGRDAGLAAVGHVIRHLELRLTGAQ